MTFFQNTVVIITGAGSGIGRHLTLQAATDDAHVIATDVNETTLAETKNLATGRVETVRLDVSDVDAITAFAAEVIPTLAGRKLILVNNAGVALASGPFADTDLRDFEWLLNINLWGVVRMTKAFLPYMTQPNRNGKPTGHIVNISSVFGLAGVMNQSAYCTAKFGVRGFSDVLRMELADTDIKVTCVHPGGIKTNIASSARIGKGGFVTEAMHRQGSISFAKTARTTPERAARIIWNGVRQAKARVLIGADAQLFEWITRLFPTRYVGMLKTQIEKAFATGV